MLISAFNAYQSDNTAFLMVIIVDKRVSKARLLSQTSAYPEVATCHIIAISQDCSRELHSRVDAWYPDTPRVTLRLRYSEQ